MAKETTLVACRIPCGLVLHHPVNRKVSVKLDGSYASKVLGSNFALTEVDSDFWSAWKSAYGKNPIVTSLAIFEVKSESEANAKAKELRNERTGFERMPQSAMGVSKAVS